jgi:hypothetical protein
MVKWLAGIGDGAKGSQYFKELQSVNFGIMCGMGKKVYTPFLSARNSAEKRG